MELKIFELGWHGHESRDSYLFTHLNKTEEDFKKDVKYLLDKYARAYLQSEESWVSAREWIKFIAPKMSELGYLQIYTIIKSFFGNEIISEGSESESWGKVVGDYWLQQAITKNEEKGIENQRALESIGKNHTN